MFNFSTSYLNAESQSVSSSDPSSVVSLFPLITSGLLASDILSDGSVIEVVLYEASGFNGLCERLAAGLEIEMKRSNKATIPQLS